MIKIKLDDLARWTHHSHYIIRLLSGKWRFGFSFFIIDKDKFKIGQKVFKVYEKDKWGKDIQKHWPLVGNKKKYFIMPVKIFNTPKRRQTYFDRTYEEYYAYDCYNEHISSYGFCMGHAHSEESLFPTHNEALKYIRLLE